ncbi:MAG: Gfo/Idh/MocA family oxidoreductase, partial [Candidatus Nanohaloarchaea archaeon]
KIYQIGLGSFGRYGFEKLVEMHNYLEEVHVELVGVADKDFERLEAAEKFAERNDIELETFTTDRELYDAAKEEEGDVMIYDAGPSEAHSSHIHRSLENGFFHLAEKPPSLDREGHMKEKQLAKDSDVFYKVDFIERESPVVRAAIDILEGEDIDSIKVFRESSAGVQKALQPAERPLGVGVGVVA